MDSSQIFQSFMEDIDRVCVSLIESHGLKYSQKEEKLSNPLMRWLDFVSRYIPKSERQIVLSKELHKKLESSLSQQVIEEFSEFSRRSISGSDLNPFQSKGLVIHNDTSNNKKQKRTDLLFADWGILHFHLSNEIKPEQYFSVRSNWLLFSLVYENVIFCIDILPHAEQDIFSRQEMLEIIYRNWPRLLAGYEMKDVKAGTNWSDSEISKLRKAGICSSYFIEGKAFVPRGLGLTMAAISIKNINMEQNVIHGVRCIANIIEDPQSKFAQIGYKSPKYELSLTPNGLAVYDVNNDVAYVLPRAKSGKEPLALLHDLVAPSWVQLKEN